MKKYTFHLLSLVHLPQSKKYMSCAFTQKNRKLAKMLTSLGHIVYFYGSEGSDVEEYCKLDNLKFIQTHTLEDICKDYGDGDNRFEIGYDWTNTDFRHDFNSQRKPSTYKFIGKCIEEINKNKKEDHFLLCTQGYYQKPISEAVKLFLTCEPGVGYRGSCHQFRAFESSYIQNFTYGSEHPFECINGSYYDRVIPNYFDDEDIEFSSKKEDYFLFIGRMIKRKGIITAYLVAKELGRKLIIVGQGGKILPNGNLTATTDPDFEIPPATWEYVGFADIEKRKHLMAKAKVVFTPTEYLECFAGTHIEAMLSGTPVITTNFGVFPGTVIDGINGYKCNTLDDFIKNTVRAEDELKPVAVRKSAEKYIMDNVKYEYQKWFDDLYNVYESVVDPFKKGWHRIEWNK